MGRPVVATDHGGARETVVPGITGWLVPPRDPAALAAAIEETLALGPEERAAFGRQARAQVAAGYTREIMCARTIEVYEELLFPETATVVVNRTQPMPAWHETGPMSEMTDAQVGLS
jgi:glycosyltransferase involved in cell wall biosynthesis